MGWRMSEMKMTRILESQKTRRVADLVVGLSLFAGLFYTTMSLFA
jgi:hypothetical protein